MNIYPYSGCNVLAQILRPRFLLYRSFHSDRMPWLRLHQYLHDEGALVPSSPRPLKGHLVAFCVSRHADRSPYPYETPDFDWTRFNCNEITCFRRCRHRHDGRNDEFQRSLLQTYEHCNCQHAVMVVRTLDAIARSNSGVSFFALQCERGRHRSLGSAMHLAHVCYELGADTVVEYFDEPDRGHASRLCTAVGCGCIYQVPSEDILRVFPSIETTLLHHMRMLERRSSWIRENRDGFDCLIEIAVWLDDDV